MSKKVDVNNFANRQIGDVGADSRFSYYAGTSEELSKLVEENIHNKQVGYRDGVYIVPVPSDNFYSGISKVDENSIMWNRMEARRIGEEPVLVSSNLNGVKEPAKFVNIVIYSHEVLAENNEFSTDADFEIISINASFDEFEPMTPETIKRNHYGDAGGTTDYKTETQLLKDLEESENYLSKYSTVDNLANFRRFYDKENKLSKEELKDLIIENCKCNDPKVLIKYIRDFLGLDLEVEDILKIDSTLRLIREMQAELERELEEELEKEDMSF